MYYAAPLIFFGKSGLVQRATAWLLMLVMCWQPTLALAEIVPVAPDGLRPTLDAAANGTPIINIADPNSAGLSHNRYQSFNVDQQGLILNNSQQLVQTDLAGYIDLNPNLKSGPASIILNEVLTNNPSQLLGHIEVAGQQADVIIANPYGITCDGCGFINSHRATLTTGVPLFSDSGALSGFDIRTGQVTIDGAGINTGNISRFDILARSIALNAEVHGQEINMHGGAGQVSYSTLTSTGNQTDSAPAFAISSSALGGIYGDRIRLLATEQGVGVNLLAPVAAQTGDLTVSASGEVRYATLASSGAATLSSNTAIIGGGDLLAGGDLLLNAPQIRFVDGTVTGRSTAIMADHLQLDSPAAVVVERADQQLRIDVKSLSNAGRLHGEGGLTVSAETIDNSGVISSSRLLGVDAAALINAGTIGGLGFTSVNATSLDNRSGGLLYGGNGLRLWSGTLINRGDIYSDGNLTIENGSGIRADIVENRSGTIEATGNIRILAQNFLNLRDLFGYDDLLVFGEADWQCVSCAGINYEVGYRITETRERAITQNSAAASLFAGGSLYINSSVLDNQYSTIASGAGMTLIADQYLRNVALDGSRYRDTYVYSADIDMFEHNGNVSGSGNTINRYNQLNAAGQNPDSMLAVEDTLVSRYSLTSRETEQLDATPLASASIIAGGNLSITTPLQINSGVGAEALDNLGQQAVRDLVPGYDDSAVSTAISQFNGVEIDGADLAGLLDRVNGGILSYATTGSGYLIETDPLFTHYATFINSTYLLDRLGWDPDEYDLLLGNGYVELLLLRELILKASGRVLLTDSYRSEQQQYQALMDNAIYAAEALDLIPGVALTADQINALQQDIVWLEKQEVMGKTVLVPTLYLAAGSADIRSDGALMAASGGVRIDAGGMLNSGDIQSGSNMQLHAGAGGFYNSGVIDAGGNLLIASDGSIENLSGMLSANQMLLRSKQDIVHSRAMGDNGAARAGLIDARGNLVMMANNIGVHGSDIGARNVRMDARGNIVIESIEQHDSHRDTYRRTATTTSTTTQLGSNIRAAVNLVMRVGEDIDAAASQLEAGRDLALIAEGDVRLTSRENRAQQQVHSTIPWRRQQSESVQISQVGSEASAGRKMTVRGQNVEVAGSRLAASGMYIRAAENILIHSVENQSSRHSSSGRSYNKSESITQIPSELNATLDMLLISRGDTDIGASDLASGRALQLAAGGNIGVRSAEDYEHSDSYRRGSSKRIRRINTDVTQRAATLTAGTDLSATAGNDITTVSARMSAGEDLSLQAGNDVNFLAAKDSSYSYSKVKKKRWYGSKTTVRSSYDETVQETVLEAGGGVLVNMRRDGDGNLLHTRNVGNVVLDAVSILSGTDTAIYAGGNLVMDAQLEHSRTFRETTRSYSGVAQIGALAVASVLTPQTLASGQSLELKGNSGRGGTSAKVVQATIESTGDTYLLSGGDMTLTASSLVLENFTALAGMNRGDEPGHIMLRGLHDQESDWKYKSSFSVGVRTDGSSISIARQQEHRERNESSDYIGTQVTASGHTDVSTDGDIVIIGSSLNTAGNAQFEAGGSISVLDDVNRSRNYQSTVNRDLRIEASSGDSRAEVFAGYQEEHRQEAETITEVAGSAIAATNITLISGKDVTLSGSMLYAQKVEEGQRGISGNVVIDAAGDINTLDGTGESSFSVINETLRVGVSVSAQENISAVVDAFDSLTEAEGGLNTASATLQTVDSLNGARSGAVTANAAVVAEWSREQRDSRQTTAVPTLIEAEGNLVLRSGRDQRHVGTQANAGGTLSVVAGGKLLMESAQSHSRSSSDSDSASLSIGLSSSNGLNVTGSGAYAKSNNGGTKHINVVFEGADVDIETGGDLALDGAVVKAGQLRTHIGGDLLIASHQDTGRTRGESANGSLTLGTSAVSGSVGGSRTVGDRAWVEQQSGLFAEDRLDAYIAGHTTLTGGAIISESGNLDVSTASLSFSDIQDYDNFRSTSAQFGLGTPQGGAGKPKETASQQNLIPGLGTNSINIRHEETERRQQTSATIGAGNLTVRDDISSGEDSSSGLNRDAAIAQQITRDRESSYHLYLSDRSLQGVGLLDSDDNPHNSRLNQLKDTFHAGLALSEIAETAVGGIDEIDNALVMGLTVGQATSQEGAGLGLLHDERMLDFAGQVGDGVLAASQLVVTHSDRTDARWFGVGEQNGFQENYQRMQDAREGNLQSRSTLDDIAVGEESTDLVDVINNVTDYAAEAGQIAMSTMAVALSGDKEDQILFYDASMTGKEFDAGIAAEAAGVANRNEDTGGVNASSVNLRDSRELVAAVAEESRHLQGGDDEFANVYADRVAYLWEKQNRTENRTTGGTTSQTEWVTNNRNVLDSNNRVFAAMRPSQMEFRHFSEREARMLSMARQEIINRPGLMLEEKQIIIAQLEAVACAEVRCAQGVPDADELKQHLLLIQKLGDQLIQQGLDITTMLAELEIDTVIHRGAGQTRRGYRGDKHAFGYTSDDWLSDMSLVNDELITRGGGVVRSVGGAVSAGSGIIMTGTGAASCGVTFGAGCAVAVVAGVPLTALGAMEMDAGWQTMTGDYVSTHGQRVLDSFSIDTHQGHFSVLENMTERAAIFSAEMLSGRIGGKYFVDTVARSRAVGVDDVVPDKTSPSELAKGFQGSRDYPGVDRYRDITLRKGTIIYAGEPGVTGFFTTSSAIRRTDLDATALFEGLQVAPRNGLYRPGVTAFEILEDTPAAFGITRANTRYGEGGLPQIYIPGHSEVVRPIVSYPLKNRVVGSE